MAPKVKKRNQNSLLKEIATILCQRENNASLGKMCKKKDKFFIFQVNYPAKIYILML
jgi:hypothetical protein